MSMLSPEKINANSNATQYNDDLDIYEEGPSSPFLEDVGRDNQENIAPTLAATPTKQQLIDFEDDSVPQSAFRVESGKKSGLKERSSPLKSPVKNLLEDFEDAAIQTPNRSRASTLRSSPVKRQITEDFEAATAQTPNRSRASTLKSSPAKQHIVEDSEAVTAQTPNGGYASALRNSPAKSQIGEERPGSAMSSRTRKSRSPSKSSVLSSVPSDIEVTPRAPSLGAAIDLAPTASKRPSPSETPSRPGAELRDNEGLTIATNRFMEDAEIDRSRKRRKSHENQYEVNMEADITEFNPDATTPDLDDTHFSDFSEMPGLDMTKFASFNKSPTKSGDVSESKQTE